MDLVGPTHCSLGRMRVELQPRCMSFEEQDLTEDISGLDVARLGVQVQERIRQGGAIKKPEELSSSGVTEAADEDAPPLVETPIAEESAASQKVAEEIYAFGAAVESEEKKDE